MSTRPVRGIFLNQLDEAHINPNLVLLDSASSHHLFRNEILMAIVTFSFFNTVARRKGMYPDRDVRKADSPLFRGAPGFNNRHALLIRLLFLSLYRYIYI